MDLASVAGFKKSATSASVTSTSAYATTCCVGHTYQLFPCFRLFGNQSVLTSKHINPCYGLDVLQVTLAFGSTNKCIF